MCNDIGEAAYVESLVASAFVVRCKNLPDSAQVLVHMPQWRATAPARNARPC